MIMKMKNGKKNILTLAEQKTTATFKLMSGQIKTLQKSLKVTQDELESYRGKYHEVDKNYAVAASKNSTLVFHEVLKFGVSAIAGGIGVNFISAQSYTKGIILIVVAVLIYATIVYSDRN